MKNFITSILLLLVATFAKAQAPSCTIAVAASSSFVCSGASVTLVATGATNYTWYPGGQTGSAIVVTPTASTCYTAFGTSSGCTMAGAVQCIGVQSTPSVAISGPTAVCAGSSATLLASGASSYTWAPGGQTGVGIVVTPSATTCYTLYGSNACGLNGTVKCITVLTASNIVINGNLNVCSGNTTTLTASGAPSYTWSNGQTGTSIVVSPTATTCYTAYGATGCGWTGGVACVTVQSSPNITISGPNTVCAGSTLVLTASGATSYTWFPGGQTGATFVAFPFSSTCYTVIGNTAGCGSVAAVKCVSVQSTPTVTVNGPTSICSGASATLYASGATNYTWTIPFTTIVSPSLAFTATSSACYTVTGNNPGCGSSSSYVHCYTLQPSPNVTINGNLSICPGISTTLTASGATNYTWFPGGQTGASIVVSPTVFTCYNVLGNTSGCGSASAVACVSVQSSPNVTISGPNTVCAGSTLVLTASGATSYTWFPGGQTGATFVAFPFSSTCYTVIGNTICGLITGVKCVSVQPTSTVTVSASQSVCAGSSATLTASGASSYTWLPGGQTGASIVVSPTASTCYTVTGNTSGCGSAQAIACVNVASPGTATISGPGSVCSGGSATLVAYGGSSFTWSPGGQTGAGIVVSPTASTCYTVTGNTICGLVTGIKCITVQPTSITVSGPSLVCGSFATLVASGATNYTWLPTTTVGPTVGIYVTSNTCYTVIGSTPGCSSGSAVHCLTVQPTSTVAISGNLSICPGGSSTLSASGAGSYTWFPGGQTGASIVVSPTVFTCYTVLGNNTGCGSPSVSACVTIQPSSSITISGPTSLCSGSSATLVASGAANYTWFPGGQTGAGIVITPTASTCYTVVGNSGCGTGAALHCVTVSPSSSITVNGPNSVCSGSSATLSASGAGSYTWFPGGQTGAAIIVTPTASTCYTVLGNSGCGSGAALHCVTVSPSSTITISGPNSVCSGSSATLVASGATNYTWFPGGQTGAGIVITPTASTCYTVTALNTNSLCPTTSAVKCVSVQTSSSITVSGPNVVCAGSGATLVASGASNYTWFPGGQTGAAIVVTPTASTCYTVLGTSGCGSGAALHCVSVQSAPNITVNGGGVICSGASATLVASGAANYTWFPGGQTGAGIVVTPTASGCYTVVGTTTSGCTGAAAACFSVTPGITISGSGTVCSGGSTTLSASGGANYIWFPGGQTGANIVVSPTASTCYTVISTGTACSNSAVKCVIVQMAPQITVNGSSVSCQGSAVNLTASGATNYTWVPGNLTGSSVAVSPTVNTCYTVVGTATNGCIGVTSKCLIVASNPTLTVTGSNILCAGNSATFTASGAVSYTWNTGSTSSSIVLAPTASGCYTVIGANAQGCVGGAVKCFSVIPSITVSVSGNFSICPYGAANLVASGASSYTWSTGSTSSSISVSPSVTTAYLVTGSSGGCSQTKSVAVTVNPLPTVTAMSSSSIICAGSSATLVASGAATYTWNNGTNAPAIIVSPSVTTSYTVVGSSGQGCNSGVIITQYVSTCTGIEINAKQSAGVSMYPNPARSELTLQSDVAGNIHYSVCDMMGREIVKGSFNDIKTIDLSAYANGTYIIRFEASSGLSYKKLIIEH